MRYIDPFIKIQPPIHIFFISMIEIETLSQCHCVKLPMSPWLGPQVVLDHFVLVIRQ